MGNTRLHFFLILLSTTTTTLSFGNPHKLQQQPLRPTRTLGSLFGGGSAKPTPPQQPPPPTQHHVQQQQQQPSEQKSVLSPLVQQQQGVSGVRPLVYQVKYYDRINNNVVEYPSSEYSRNFNAIDKAGVVDQQQQQQVVVPQQQQPSALYVGQPPTAVYTPQRYYYNPLIPQQQPLQDQIVYTIANIGNTQVLIPCSTTSSLQDQLIYDSTIALNVEPQVTRLPNQQSQQQQQYNPPPQSTSPQPQRTPYIPQQTIQQPLVRDQVIAAAQELTALNALPGSAIVASNINTPYTQGSYFYYIIPNSTPQYVEPIIPQQQQQPQRVVNPYLNPYFRYGQQSSVLGGVGAGGVPVVLLNGYGYPYGVQNQVVVPQASGNVPVRSQVVVQSNGVGSGGVVGAVASQQGQQQGVVQQQPNVQAQAQQQQQQQQMKG